MHHIYPAYSFRFFAKGLSNTRGGPTTEISRHRLGKDLSLRRYPAGQEPLKTGTVGGWLH